MAIVTSGDDTPIAVWQTGAGPPLVMVHGVLADHTTTWRHVLPLLSRSFTVYVMDRRGRGGSGDAPRYALGREAEDVAAVVESIPGPVNLLGHSHGALCALEAARLTTTLRRLVLYEGVPRKGEVQLPVPVLDRLEELFRAGEVEEMLVVMLGYLVGIPPDEIRLLRSQGDAWATRLSNARTLVRELRAGSGYAFAPERFAEMRTPTLLLVGGDSPAVEHQDARAVARGLPDARVAILPGQGHLAMYTAPALFVEEVVRFLAT
jgi:pimeloyl-ACP methyl ester carboxylesterase